MKQHNLHDGAFTGIEAAIVLIAFITVGSVFTYVMLNTGFFATQVSQKTANAGVQGASSNVIVVGDILGLSPNLTGIETVEFRVRLSSGGTPVEFTGSQIIISTEGSQLKPPLMFIQSGAAQPGEWNISNVGDVNNDGVLSANEIWTIDVKPMGGIANGTEFTLEVKPPGGASFTIRRTVPRGLDPVNILY
jgi:flagellin FlaB